MRNSTLIGPSARLAAIVATSVLSGGLLGMIGGFGGPGLAQSVPPAEHKGLNVETLGSVPAESMAAQVGLNGHILLLRKITIAPGGQIAKHSAETTPAVVYMLSGTWTEGRVGSETAHPAGTSFIEDKATVHWFHNRGAEPATALVCDIKPAS